MNNTVALKWDENGGEERIHQMIAEYRIRHRRPEKY